MTISAAVLRFRPPCAQAWRVSGSPAPAAPPSAPPEREPSADCGTPSGGNENY